MKTLYLLRHAKSPKDMDVPRDMDRPLTERGYADIAEVSAKMKDKKTDVEVIISTPAIRAFSTAVIMARALDYEEDKIVLNKNLYEASTKQFIDELEKLDNDIHSVMIVGHNPAISDVLIKLSKAKIEEMPTSSVACLVADTYSWKDVKEVKFRLEFFITPS